MTAQWLTVSDICSRVGVTPAAITNLMKTDDWTLEVERRGSDKYHADGFYYLIKWDPDSMSERERAFFFRNQLPTFEEDFVSTSDLEEGECYSIRQLSAATGIHSGSIYNMVNHDDDFPLTVSRVYALNTKNNSVQKQKVLEWDSSAWLSYRGGFRDGEWRDVRDVAEYFNIPESSIVSDIQSGWFHMKSKVRNHNRYIQWDQGLWDVWLREQQVEEEEIVSLEDLAAMEDAAEQVVTITDQDVDWSGPLTIQDVELGIKVIYETSDCSYFDTLEEARQHSVAMIEAAKRREEEDKLIAFFKSTQGANDEQLRSLAKDFLTQFEWKG